MIAASQSYPLTRAKGGQWRRAGTEQVCLVDKRVAGALCTFLYMGRCVMRATPQKTCMTLVETWKHRQHRDRREVADHRGVPGDVMEQRR
jgi:hypothetical protein